MAMKCFLGPEGEEATETRSEGLYMKQNTGLSGNAIGKHTTC